jgi:hypothetical protein
MSAKSKGTTPKGCQGVSRRKVCAPSYLISNKGVVIRLSQLFIAHDIKTSPPSFQALLMLYVTPRPPPHSLDRDRKIIQDALF